QRSRGSPPQGDRTRAETTQHRETQASLARSLERIVQTVAAWQRIQCNHRPVFDVQVVRAAAPLLTEIAAQLRVRPLPAQLIARVGRLLTDGASPLYGHDTAELHSEQHLITRHAERIVASTTTAGDPLAPS